MMKVGQAIYAQPGAEEWATPEGDAATPDEDGVVDAEVEEDDKK
jgi:hypothetical protein